MMTTSRKPSPLVLAVLHRVISDEALAGDLLEEFGAGRSVFWLSRQVLAAAWSRLIHRHAPNREPNGTAHPAEDAQPVGLSLVIFGAAAEIIEMAQSGIWWVAPVVLGGAVLMSALKLRSHHRASFTGRRALLG
jgi:hypothetical protein